MSNKRFGVPLTMPTFGHGEQLALIRAVEVGEHEPRAGLVLDRDGGFVAIRMRRETRRVPHRVQRDGAVRQRDVRRIVGREQRAGAENLLDGLRLADGGADAVHDHRAARSVKIGQPIVGRRVALGARARAVGGDGLDAPAREARPLLIRDAAVRA